MLKKTQSKYSKQKAQGMLNAEKAIQLRTKGYNYAQIGEELGLTAEGARRATKRAFELIKETQRETAEEVLLIELQSLDALEKQLMGSIGEGTIENKLQLNILEKVLRIKNHRAKLLGLFAPEKQEITVSQPQITLQLPPDFSLNPLPNELNGEIIDAEFEES